MMIEVNLLPGARKSARSSPRLGLADAFTGLASRIRDPWLLGSAAAVVASLAVVGVLFTSQQARASDLGSRLEVAVRDSTRFARVLAARRKLTAERDSVHRQLLIIRTIDDNRYNWAHILDEISRALPAYTWLTILEQTSKAPLPPGADTLPPGAKPAVIAADTSSKGRMPKDTVNVHPELTFRLVGQTVDIQALTSFMRQLESSPFIQKVSLTRSEIVIVDAKDITQFELSAAFEVPPAGFVRTAPLVVPVR